MHNDVAERLIANLDHKPIKHNQGSWLTNGKSVFVISPDDRWSCATSGCAAGFLFLEEAPEGTIFDVSQERIFTDIDEKNAFTTEMSKTYPNWSELPGTPVVQWGANILGITFTDAYDLFYDFGETNDIVHKIQALMED